MMECLHLSLSTKVSPRLRTKTPSSKKLDPGASLPPSGPRGLRGARGISSSSPNMYNDPTKSLPVGSHSRLPAYNKGGRTTPSGGRTTPSLIPTPRGGLRRPTSTTPGSSPAPLKKTVPSPRSASVGPEKLAQQLANSNSYRNSALKVGRPGSARLADGILQCLL